MNDSSRRTSDTRDSLLAGQIGDVDEGVVEGGIDVGNTENELALSDLGAERDGFLNGNLGLLGGLLVHPLVRLHIQHKTSSFRPLRTNTQHPRA